MRRSNQRRDAVFACYQQEVTDRPLSVLLADGKPFTIELAKGVEKHRSELDEVIAEYAKGWNLNRIAPLEKNIMRVALYEMNFRDDVPSEVAIDEAVETAKKFCGAEAPGFVNGILGAADRAMKADQDEGNDAGRTAPETGTTSETDAASGTNAALEADRTTEADEVPEEGTAPETNTGADPQEIDVPADEPVQNGEVA